MSNSEAIAGHRPARRRGSKKKRKRLPRIYRKERDSPDYGIDASSIPQFCRRNSISQAHYFALKKRGEGPDEIRVGRRVLITAEARARWRAAREKATAAAE